MVKRALLIAYHFPPIRSSSGLQRTLGLARYLGEFGWQPMVLSVHPMAYENVSSGQLADIPPDVSVTRSFAVDASRHFSIAGRYPGWLARPDRWVSWWPGAVIDGVRLIRRYRPELIYSTYPIATAHLIGHSLHKLSGLPWVADFRDPMTDVDYPPNPRLRRMFRRIEDRTVRACQRAVVTTPGAARIYAQRYPELPASHWSRIENGYDEQLFAEIEQDHERSKSLGRPGQVVLLHSGLIYPEERDPRPFFDALALLKREGHISPDRLNVRFRAAGHEEIFTPMLRKRGIEDLVDLAPGMDYRAALLEMLRADGLLIFQSASCNQQIPAKLYEYLRSGRPILGVIDPHGDTASVLTTSGVDSIVQIDDAQSIARGLMDFIRRLRNGTIAAPPASSVAGQSRRARAGEFARLFDEVVRPGSPLGRDDSETGGDSH